MCSRPKAPSIPDMPPPRAMERLPQRGMVSQDARRQVTAGMGNTASGATVLGPAAASAQRGAGGAGTGLGAQPAGVRGSNPASVAQPNARAGSGAAGAGAADQPFDLAGLFPRLMGVDRIKAGTAWSGRAKMNTLMGR